MHFLTADNIKQAQSQYPGLRQTAPGILEGTLKFRAVYDDAELEDEFHVRITAANPHSDYLPALYETGGRTEAIALARDIEDTRDVHRNCDGTACLCVKQMERIKCPAGSSLLVYLNELVVPYLYGLSSFEKTGKWPWADYSHGALGLIEYYVDSVDDDARDNIFTVLRCIRSEHNWKDYSKQLRQPSGERMCLCGSRKPFTRCHPRAWQGLAIFRRKLERHGFNLKNPFS